jgi:hypothetical protein
VQNRLSMLHVAFSFYLKFESEVRVHLVLAHTAAVARPGALV